MTRPTLAPEEVVLRAITEAQWDEKNCRVSSAIFEGSAISLSRLAVLCEEEIFRIFLTDLDKPTNSLRAAGKISVGRIIESGLENTANPLVLTVVADPIPPDNALGLTPNAAHAEIPEKVTRGVSKRIRDKLIVVPILR